ncbi:MAG: stage II sporulation protein E [Bacillota bacterium]
MHLPEVYPYRRIAGAPRQRTSANKINKVRQPDIYLGRWLGQFFLADALVLQLIGIILAQSSLMGGLSPFGPAFLAVIGQTHRFLLWPLAIEMTLIPVLIGKIPLISVAAYPVILLISWFYGGYFNRHRWLLPLFASLIPLTIKTGFLYMDKPLVYAQILLGIEAVMTACLAITFITAASVLNLRKWRVGLSLEEAACLSLVLVGIWAGLGEAKVWGLSVRQVSGIIAVMLAALVWGSGAGAALGAVVGMMPNLLGQPYPPMIGTYALSGLFAGSVRRYGKIGIILGFVLGQMVLSWYAQDFAAWKETLVEAALAGLFFVFIPPKSIKDWQLSRLGETPGEKVWPEKIRQLAAQRVTEISILFHEMAAAFQHPANSAEVKQDSSVGSVFNDIAVRVCVNCSMHDVCWEKDFYITSRRLLDLFAIAEAKGWAGPRDVPEEIQRRCNRTKELAMAASCLIGAFQKERQLLRRLEDSRLLVAAQLSGVAGMMHELSLELQREAKFYEDMESFILREAKRFGMDLTAVHALQGSGDWLEVVVKSSACRGEMDCARIVSPIVSRMTGRRLAVDLGGCSLAENGTNCFFRLYPAPVYEVSASFAQAKAKESGISGDWYCSQTIRGGQHLLALSDGMGSGPRAAEESRAAINLVSQLLAAGFPYPLAIKTVNSALVLRSADETFATLDIVLIDLNSGESELVKIGAAGSYLVRRDQVTVIKASSLPIGILAQVEPEIQRVKFQAGDLIVMVTDGIIEWQGKDWVAEALRKMSKKEPQEIAEQLLAAALTRCNQEARDDISILVARLDLQAV